MRPIIGLTGLAGAGKSTAADHLVAAHGFVRVKFAGPLKSMLAALGLGPDEIEGHLKEVPSDLLCGRTPRQAMQTLGAEWGRDLIGPDLWVRAWGKAVDEALTDGAAGIVADDVRFLNEVTAIHERGGYVLRLTRERAGSASGATHVSETGGVPFDAVLTNDGSVADLHEVLDTLAGIERLRSAA